MRNVRSIVDSCKKRHITILKIIIVVGLLVVAFCLMKKNSIKDKQNEVNYIMNTADSNFESYDDQELSGVIHQEEYLSINEKYTDDSYLQFSDLVGMKFMHSSGAGAWSTIVTINADGTFEGYFHDTNRGNINHNLYPCGTKYECKFSGKFSTMIKSDNYEYRIKCEYINVEGIIGEENIIDGYRIINTEPYGFENADELILYLPGKPANDLSEEFISWSHGKAENGMLECYGLYNVNSEDGFIVW